MYILYSLYPYQHLLACLSTPGLQELYARRVGISGRLPKELGELSQLRVLSMGNNHLCGSLPVPLSALHCTVPLCSASLSALHYTA